MTKIVKSTTKGQITLPAEWRRRFKTDKFIAKAKGDVLEITPLEIEKIEKNKEYTVFDAIRDNGGKGIKAEDLVKIVKKTL